MDKLKQAAHAFHDKVGPSDDMAPPPGQDRAQNKPVDPPNPSDQRTSAASSSGTAFDQSKVKVVYVLGGPGAGKGSNCQRLVDDFDFVHLSAGDLLRAEQNREGSEYGDLIRHNIREGTIVPMEVTIKLLENAMRESIDKGQSRFLIDGFPRKLDQAHKFDESVCPSSLVLVLTCPEKVLLERLLERGKTSGRDDDNEESIKKRFKTFTETSSPVIEYYRGSGKVLELDSTPPLDEVYASVRAGVQEKLGISPKSGAKSTAN